MKKNDVPREIVGGQVGSNETPAIGDVRGNRAGKGIVGERNEPRRQALAEEGRGISPEKALKEREVEEA